MHSALPTGSAAASIGECLARAVLLLREAGTDSPERDARLLIGAALGSDQLRLIARRDEATTAEDRVRIDALIARRMRREPVSRILGQRSFYGRDFSLTAATLDPRPDTETLVELALEIAEEERWRERPIRIVDVGTGSGCILLTLLAELPLATGLGVDIAADAVEAARANAIRLGLSDRTEWAVGRSLRGVDGPFDLLVSNPPYIPSADIAGLEPEVRDFDPLGALDGGSDGLDVYRELAADVPRVVQGGWALLEIGAGQAPDVDALLNGAAFGVRRHCRDLGGHIRCVAVRTHGEPCGKMDLDSFDVRDNVFIRR